MGGGIALTAVGGLTTKILTFVGGIAGTAAAAIVYNVIERLDSEIPGAAAFINDAIESGQLNVTPQNVDSLLQFIENKTSMAAYLKATGNHLALYDGKIVKVGSAIAQALRSNNVIEKLSHDSATGGISNVQMYPPKTLRNVNADVIKGYLQAATLV